jgi:hypothetical protein
MEATDYFAVCAPGLLISAMGRDSDIEKAIAKVKVKLAHYRAAGKAQSVPLGCERTSTIEIYDARGHNDVWLDLSGVNGDGGGDPPKLIETRKVKVF